MERKQTFEILFGAFYISVSSCLFYIPKFPAYRGGGGRISALHILRAKFSENWSMRKKKMRNLYYGVHFPTLVKIPYMVFRARRIAFFLVNEVEHQKINQTTPYDAISLSFLCSTYYLAD